MKTLYTLLLAFGLCFTVHAQNYSIYTLDDKKSLLNVNEIKHLDRLLFEPLPTVLFSNNKMLKLYSSDNSVNKKIVLQNQYKLESNLAGLNITDFNTAEVLKIGYKQDISYNIDPILLQNLTSLRYIYLISYDNITYDDVLAALEPVLRYVNSNVEVIYKVSQGD